MTWDTAALPGPKPSWMSGAVDVLRPVAPWDSGFDTFTRRPGAFLFWKTLPSVSCHGHQHPCSREQPAVGTGSISSLCEVMELGWLPGAGKGSLALTPHTGHLQAEIRPHEALQETGRGHGSSTLEGAMGRRCCFVPGGVCCSPRDATREKKGAGQRRPLLPAGRGHRRFHFASLAQAVNLA